MKILVSLIAFAISCFFSSSEYSDLTFLDKRIYHMGKIASYDTTFLKTIRFTNNSTEDLEILKVYKSCSCTDVKLSSKCLKPNEVGYVEITVNPLNSIGLQEITVHLIANTEIKDHVIRILFEVE